MGCAGVEAVEDEAAGALAAEDEVPLASEPPPVAMSISVFSPSRPEMPYKNADTSSEK